MKRTHFFAVLMVVFKLLLTVEVSAQGSEPISYQEKFTFTRGEVLVFADFTIEFVGTREGAFYPGTTRRLAPIFEFKVEHQQSTQLLRWSSGTGAIGPSFFRVAAKCFALELLYSDTKGRLAEDEAVVSLQGSELCQYLPK